MPNTNGETLDTLLNQLKNLRIKEDRIRAEQNQILLQISELRGAQRTRNDQEVVNAKREAQNATPLSHATIFRAGDRVKIINKIKKPCDWKGPWNPTVAAKHRLATVTDVSTTTDRVCIRTDTGIDTWRVSRNLAPLP